MHKHSRFFLLATSSGLFLRLIFLWRFPAITSDSFIYGDIAKNWLQHSVYGLTELGDIVPTYIRLPGYPAFLAIIFRIFGMEHYRAVLFIQILIDLGTCTVIADLARRMISARAAQAAFLLSALCPFFANYTAAVLTETLEIFFTALALDFAIAALAALESCRLRLWLGCGLSVAGCLLLRPDGGLLLISLQGWLVWTAMRRLRKRASVSPLIVGAFVVGGLALAPLVPWTLRNLHTLQRWQPLAPRYANEENLYVPMGFNRWLKTWAADSVSNEEVYWKVPGGSIDSGDLPSRAFDSPAEQDQTEQLLDDYNHQLHIEPDLDARFEALAEERIRAAPLRYYVWLPTVRITDMWLRPRTELLPSDPRWWEFDDTTRWLVLSIALGAINLAYVALACIGLIRLRSAQHLGLLLMFVILRSAFLGTMENPEPRYTLECYPIVIIFASALFSSSFQSSTAR